MKATAIIMGICAVAWYTMAWGAGYFDVPVEGQKPAVVEETTASTNETRTVYMVQIDIRNSSFSLDIGKHIRNAMNAVQMDIPVDKEFYDAVTEGQELKSEFKTASFVMKGSISSVKIKCVKKWTTIKPTKEAKK